VRGTIAHRRIDAVDEVFMFRKVAIAALVVFTSACSPGSGADVVDAAGADVPCDVFENARLCYCPGGAQGISLCTGGVWAACDCNFIDAGSDTGARDATMDTAAPTDTGVVPDAATE
jgi:hypothetical protein